MSDMKDVKEMNKGRKAKCLKCGEWLQIHTDAEDIIEPFQYMVCEKCGVVYSRCLDYHRIATMNEAYGKWSEDEGLGEFLELNRKEDVNNEE